MITIDPPHLGSPERLAEHLVMQARIHNEAVESTFNGSPMTAHLNDTPRVVQLRWHYERLLIQIADGVMNVRDVADHRFTR